MKCGDLITLTPGVRTTTYLSEINNPGGFTGVVISFSPPNLEKSMWFNEIHVSVPSEDGRIFRLLLTDVELECNFQVIS